MLATFRILRMNRGRMNRGQQLLEATKAFGACSDEVLKNEAARLPAQKQNVRFGRLPLPPKNCIT